MKKEERKKNWSIGNIVRNAKQQLNTLIINVRIVKMIEINLRDRYKKHNFFRFCNKCNEKFTPKGKFQYLCELCSRNIRNENFKNLINVRRLKYLEL